MTLPVRLIQLLTQAVLLSGVCACADLNFEHTLVSSALPGADCSVTTASRVSTADQPCSGLRHSFSNQDIRTTGATSLAVALRMLDPSIVTGRLSP
jgi:hypothetical protein